MDPFVEPVTLLCNHTFCRGCLVDVENKRCPTCQLLFWVPPNNNYVLVDILKKVYGEEIYNKAVEDSTKDKEKGELREKIEAEMWRGIAEQIIIDPHDGPRQFPMRVNAHDEVWQPPELTFIEKFERTVVHHPIIAICIIVMIGPALMNVQKAVEKKVCKLLNLT